MEGKRSHWKRKGKQGLVMKITDHVKGMSSFQYYRAGNLWFKTDSSFEFPVPCADVEGATVDATMKSMMLMRWIRKHIETIKEGVDV